MMVTHVSKVFVFAITRESDRQSESATFTTPLRSNNKYSNTTFSIKNNENYKLFKLFLLNIII